MKKTHNLYSIKLSQSKSFNRLGKFNIKVTSFGRLTKNQFDSIKRLTEAFIRKTMNKKKIKLWSFLFFNLTLTKLNSESRMGKGKGSVYSTAIFLKPGDIIFEINEVTTQQITEVYKFLTKKLSFTIKVSKI